MATPPKSASSEPEITVEGWSSRYAAAVRALLATEGGFVDDPKDRGGATKYGISLRFLKAEGSIDGEGFDLDMDGDLDGQDIRQLKRGHAAFIYHRCFWQRLDIEAIPRPLGEAVFDQAVNGGARAAVKMLQRAVNACYAKNPPNGLPPLTVDGRFGPSTRVAVDSILQYPALGMPALLAAYRAAAADRYRAIATINPSQKRFLKGWLSRADQLGRA